MTEVKNGDIHKRGVKIMRDGRLAQISGFCENDQLTATFTVLRRAAKS